MKKLMIIAVALMTFGAIAKPTYQVYDVKFSMTTTKYGGTTSTSCGDTYNYRTTKRSYVIQGVLAGCGCAASIADGTCENAFIRFWDATTKQQINDYDLQIAILQRIGKKGEKIENFGTFTAGSTNDAVQIELTFSGLGTYSADKTDSNLDTVSSVSGRAVGIMTAPASKGSCTACGVTDPELTKATAVCEATCTESDTSEITVLYGNYTLKYNKKKSTNAAKNGATAKTLGLPSYVQ